MTDPIRSTPPPIALGFASHVIAGISPFIMSAAIARSGLVPAMTLVYGIGSVGLMLVLGWPRWRAAVSVETRALWAPAARTAFIGGLAGFLVAGVAYYVGLARAPRVAEYIFLTRLDWILQAPVAILLLGEPWTRKGVTGGLLALTGGVMLAWSGSIGPSGVVAAAIYVAASLVGYACFTPLSSQRGVSGAAALTVWRHWVNTLGFVALLLVGEQTIALDGYAASLGVAGAIVIVLLFLLRFTALTGIPLWVLSVQAPVQAAVAVTVTFLTGGTLPLATAIAIALVVVGEYIVAVGQHPAAHRQPAPAAR